MERGRNRANDFAKALDNCIDHLVDLLKLVKCLK